MTHVRRGLRILEVSLVKRGANPGARIALAKARDDDDVVTVEKAHKAEDKVMPERKPLTKAAIYKACKVVAREQFPNDLLDVALAKWFRTPDGRRTRDVMKRAPGPWVEPEPESAEKSPLQKHLALPAFEAVNAKAKELMKADSGLTLEQAFVKVWDAEPLLKVAYKAERRTLIREMR